MHDDVPEHLQLSSEERDALPDKVRSYISALENELNTLAQRSGRDNDELRRKRYAYWKR